MPDHRGGANDRGGSNAGGPIEDPGRKFEVFEPGQAAGYGVSVEDEAGLLEAAARDLDGVEEALRRLDGGFYGRCVECGEGIGDAELEGDPLLTRCAFHR